jgi:hypothetical protein
VRACVQNMRISRGDLERGIEEIVYCARIYDVHRLRGAVFVVCVCVRAVQCSCMQCAEQ